MKRRFFVTNTALVTACLTSGAASASSVFTPDCPWHFNQELASEVVPFIDEFADRVNNQMMKLASVDKQLIRNLINPVKIIEQDISAGLISYQNAAKNLVKIKKKGDQIIVSIE